jgi:hypothetical protein
MTDTIFIGAGGRFGIGKAQATPERSSRFLQSVDDALGYWSKTASEVFPTGDSGTSMLNCLLERGGATGGCFGRARAVGSARWGRRRGGHGGKEVCRGAAVPEVGIWECTAGSWTIKNRSDSGSRSFLPDMPGSLMPTREVRNIGPRDVLVLPAGSSGVGSTKATAPRSTLCLTCEEGCHYSVSRWPAVGKLTSTKGDRP